jgi:dTDP-4-dehydrorhamnose 3,5-epimerase
MKFTQTPLSGAYLIDLDKREDERGFFSRSFCRKEFERLGLEPCYVQMNHSLSRFKGTLRGLHYQLPPAQEVKVVRCIRGRVWDCILDLRSHSPTYGHWYGAELSASQRNMMYVPKDFAHAFLSLEEDCEVLYQVSEYYTPELERGIRWNDPLFAIGWPIEPVVISDKDLCHPDFKGTAR